MRRHGSVTPAADMITEGQPRQAGHPRARQDSRAPGRTAARQAGQRARHPRRASAARVRRYLISMSDWAWPLTCDPSIGVAAWPLALPWPTVASAVAGFATPLRQGCTTASQMIMLPTATMARVQPSALVPTPTYLRPEAKTTNPMTGLMYLS